uniref:MRH domain-containing protein n=1 Tax=Phytophthora ramorum TaxID=164328 RepID=H3GKJ8_PHYRM
MKTFFVIATVLAYVAALAYAEETPAKETEDHHYGGGGGYGGYGGHKLGAMPTLSPHLKIGPKSMRTLLWLLAVASGAAAAAPKFHYGFSDCVDNERTLFYYLKSEGTFSGSEPVSGCERCPQGKYSLGGGVLFSQRTDAWTSPLSAELQTDCMTQNMYTGQWQHNCNPWVPSADGSYISSGENSGVMQNFEGTRLYSTLRVSATFVRDGSVTYKYRVDAESPYDGLMFQIDDDQGAGLVSQSDGWKEAVVQVSAGAHTLAWNYMKDYAGDAGEDKAYLKVIELVGTAWADLHCHTCGGDMTNSGGSLCAFCGPNEYAAAKSDSELDFTCYSCPPNTYAPKGSIGISSCVEQRACTMDDVDETYTACKNGARDVTYSWSQPQTCDTTLKDSIELAAPQKGVECASCARGYQLTEDDGCAACPVGQALAASGTCEQCPAGTVVVSALEYGVGTPDAWNTWPPIASTEAAQHAGWKLTKSGLLFAQHTYSDQDGGDWTRPSRSALTFNVPFVHSGSMNLTYTLSGVPTFGNDGSRAWVELEIRDAGDTNKKTKSMEYSSSPSSNDGTSRDGDGSGTGDDKSIVHLLHGGENGTFSEIVQINVTTATVKEFSLVVRATSAEAKRAIEAKLVHLGFTGTQDGAGVSCDSCPSGYEPVNPDDDQQMYGCRICPAGTFAEAGDSTGIVACGECPANTYSKEGASKCTSCGENTYSSPGAVSCAAPQALTLNASASSDTVTSSSSSSSAVVSSALSGLQVTYNLSLLEALVWGNESWILDDTVYGNASSLQSTKPVESSMAFQADGQNYWFAGLFRPLGSGWLQQVPGQVVDQEVDTTSEVAYVVLASMVNPREAGHYFQQNSGVYGNVMCSAPEQWKLVNGGSHMDILPLESGAGVKVSFTGGSPCVNGKTMSTTFNFECDLNAASQDDDKCNWDIVWRTAYACPVCDDDYFNELRSTCNGGEQLVSYARKLACYGGAESESTDTISACTESAVVLDTKALYSVYVAIVVVGFVVLLLMMGILIIHRKYRNAYNDYLYLKGKTEEKTQDDGSKETTFEFTPRSNALHSSPLGDAPSPATPDQEKIPDVVDASGAADDEGIELKLHSVQSEPRDGGYNDSQLMVIVQSDSKYSSRLPPPPASLSLMKMPIATIAVTLAYLGSLVLAADQPSMMESHQASITSGIPSDKLNAQGNIDLASHSNILISETDRAALAHSIEDKMASSPDAMNLSSVFWRVQV